MNDQYKIDWEARIQGFNQEFDNNNNNSYSQRPNPGNMEIWVQQQQQQQDINHHQQQLISFLRNKPSSTTTTTIMSRFETPASAFYATERCMGFQNYGNFSATNNNDENSNLGLSSNFYNSSSFICDSSFDRQIRPNYNNDQFVSHENVIPCVTRHFSLNPKEDHCIGGSSSYGGCFSEMSFDSCNQYHNQNQNHHQNNKQQSLKLASGNGSVTKTRIRWNQELHEKFVECLNRLGGADKATPKGILRLMESEGLTIFHVKSHLQKYRIAKYLPDSAEGKYEKRASVDVNPQLEATTTGQQIKEALHLQLDVQRRLHEQLEIQRKLQLQIEEQGKQLKKMFDMQQRRSSQGSDISTLDEEAPCSDINDDLEVSIHIPSKIS